jgi:SAM-dependent methyltransferase
MSAMPGDPTERFSSRVANYVRYRPSYPAAAIALLRAHCGLRPGARVADLGSGTGILTRLLLAAGAEVFGVEPNEGMRGAAEVLLKGVAGFHSVRGTAEATTLPGDSMDLLVAGQAFHWFKVEAARNEALRVLRAGGYGALLWNEHPSEGSAFLGDFERVARAHAPEYDQVVGSRADETAMRTFLGGDMQLATFPNQQVFDHAGLIGRLMSSSWAPEAGHPQHEPLLEGMRAAFERHAHAGRVTFPYVTLVYYGRMRPPCTP